MKGKYTLVENDLSCTSSPLAIKHGSESAHVSGTSAPLSLYINKSNEHVSDSNGRNVTEAVICLIIACISCVISLVGFTTPCLPIVKYGES